MVRGLARTVMDAVTGPRRIRRPRRRLVRIASLASAAVLSAGAPASAQQEQPVFRTGVDVVSVDVTVVDERGRPLENLEAGDFVVTVDDQPRRVVSSQYVATGFDPTAAADVESHERSYSTNEEGESAFGRSLIFVVDNANIGAGRGRDAMRAAAGFLDHLGPADRVALMTTAEGGDNIDFTTEHARVREALGDIAGRAMPTVGNYAIGISDALEFDDGHRAVVERICGAHEAAVRGTQENCFADVENQIVELLNQTRRRTAVAISRLRAVLSQLARLQGPKTMVWIAEGLVTERSMNELAFVSPLAAAARTSIYVMQLDSRSFDITTVDAPSPLAEPTDRFTRLEGLEHVASLGRGAVLRVANRPERAFDQLARELSGFYVLAVETEAGDRDGKPHRIDVDVKRVNVRVRARREFSMLGSRTARSLEDRLRALLSEPTPATELPLKLTTFSMREQGGPRVRVIISAEIDRAVAQALDLAIGFAVVDEHDTIVASGHETRRTEPVPGRENGPLLYSGAVVLEPGRYRLRFAAIDPAGREGSVTRRLVATLIDGGRLALGDLLLGASVEGDARLVPQADVQVAGRPLAAYLELYGSHPEDLEGTAVRLEVRADGEPADEGEKALLSVDARLGAVEQHVVRAARATLPVHILPPGRYNVRAVVTDEGEAVGATARVFTVRSGPSTTSASPAAGTMAPVSRIGLPIERFHATELLDPAVAAQFAERALRVDPLLAGGPPEGAMLAARAGQWQHAIDALPTRGEGLAPAFLNGLARLGTGDVRSAVAEFRAALRAASDFLPAAMYLGACHAALGNDRAAVGAWLTALTTEQDTRAVYPLLADAFLRLGEPEQTLDILKEAHQRWPGAPELAPREALAHAQLGHAREAMEVLDEHLARHPGDVDMLFLASRVLYESIRSDGSAAPEQDAARLREYAERYRAAGGTQAELVDQWVRFASEPR